MDNITERPQISSFNQELEMSLYARGSWVYDEYIGKNILKRVLKVPLDQLTFPVLMDGVKREAGSDAEGKELTYKYPVCNLPGSPDVRCFAVRESDMPCFMTHVSKQLTSFQPIELYLE